MNKRILTLALVLMALSLSVFATPVGLTDPSKFTADTIDWCQFGCAGNQLPNPDNWVSVGGGNTGWVGNDGTLQGTYNLQQGSTWDGNFATGMGLLITARHMGIPRPTSSSPLTRHSRALGLISRLTTGGASPR